MSIPIEFGEKAAADEYRDEHPDAICPVDDDRRTKTVHFVSDTPDWLLDQARAEADEGRAAREAGPGQSPLTDAERDRIDFSADRASVPWARSIKALAEQHNVSDWTSYVDDTLTVDEHREVMKRAGQEGGGARDDGDQRDAQRAQQAARRQQAEGCDHARGHCEHGDTEACEFLREACGYEESEVEQLLGGTDLEPQTDEPAGTQQEELVEVGGGDFPKMQVSPEIAGALSRSWQGYKSATSRLERELADVREAVVNARQAMRAINAIREDHGQDALHPNDLHELLAALEAMPGDIPEVRTLAHFRELDGEPEQVMEMDDQRDLSGERADPQARIAGGERGAVDSEVEQAVEENPGGLEADLRADVGSDAPTAEDTEQATPDAFQVAEGGQDTL